MSLHGISNESYRRPVIQINPSNVHLSICPVLLTDLSKASYWMSLELRKKPWAEASIRKDSPGYGTR